jgi:selT/selW/selH-like putative selenoprotein
MKQYPNLQVVGNETKPRSGAFEVTTDKGDVLFSKLSKEQRKPTSDDVDNIVGALKQ